MTALDLLPSADVMYQALVNRDASFEGIFFEPNMGQSPAAVRYVARAPRAILGFGDDGVWIEGSAGRIVLQYTIGASVSQAGNGLKGGLTPSEPGCSRRMAANSVARAEARDASSGVA